MKNSSNILTVQGTIDIIERTIYLSDWTWTRKTIYDSDLEYIIYSMTIQGEDSSFLSCGKHIEYLNEYRATIGIYMFQETYYLVFTANISWRK
jgi:hypothetical protein